MSKTKLEATVRREVWLESAGARLFAVDIGQGRPIVFIHGGLADHRAALARLGALGSSHRLIAPDLRGSGRSLHAGALSWERLADDVEALLDHLGLQRAVVGGTSMGSAVALCFALRHPKRAEGVLLLSPLYPGADQALAEPARAAMQAMAEAAQRALVSGMDALRPLYEQLPSPVRERAIEMMLSFDPPSVAATTRFLASGAQPMDSARALAALEVPVLLVPGGDPQHPPAIAELYARYLPRSTLVEPTCDDLTERVARFCDSLEWANTDGAT